MLTMLFPESSLDKNIFRYMAKKTQTSLSQASQNHLIFNNMNVVNDGLIKFLLFFLDCRNESKAPVTFLVLVTTKHSFFLIDVFQTLFSLCSSLP